MVLSIFRKADAKRLSTTVIGWLATLCGHRNARWPAVSLVASLLLAASAPAFASGDPIVFYWFGGAVVCHLTLLVGLLFANAFRPGRWLVVAVYLLLLAAFWTLWLASRPSPYLNVALIVIPCAAALALAWVLRMRRHPNEGALQ